MTRLIANFCASLRVAECEDELRIRPAARGRVHQRAAIPACRRSAAIALTFESFLRRCMVWLASWLRSYDCRHGASDTAMCEQRPSGSSRHTFLIPRAYGHVGVSRMPSDQVIHYQLQISFQIEMESSAVFASRQKNQSIRCNLRLHHPRVVVRRSKN
jgi:hypothetical protein